MVNFKPGWYSFRPPPGTILARRLHQINDEIFNVAITYSRDKDYKTAKILYLLIIQSDYSFHGAHNNLAHIYLNEEDYELALLHAKAAISNSTEDDSQDHYYDTLARAYLAIGRYVEAEHAIQKAIELNPADRGFKDLLKEIKKYL